MTTPIAANDTLKPGATARRRPASLPLTSSLRLPTLFSLLVALLLATVALSSLLWPNVVYPTEQLLLSFLPVDLFHLLVGLPLLLSCLWLVGRGRLAGLLLWPGVLLYILYSYITNLLGLPFGPLFLPYLLLVTISAYTTIVLLAAIDGKALRRQLQGRVPRRATAGWLVGLSALFVVLNLTAIVTALLSRLPTAPEHPPFVLIADFTTAIPLCLAGGVLLWRRQALGYVLGAGLLLFYSLLLLGLVPVLLFPAVYQGASVEVADTVLMLAFGLVSLALLRPWLRATGAALPARPEGQHLG